eukprot:scaffold4991_cov417-Prasinococcus_capsulatus_cf.AAC.5
MSLPAASLRKRPGRSRRATEPPKEYDAWHSRLCSGSLSSPAKAHASFTCRDGARQRKEPLLSKHQHSSSSSLHAISDTTLAVGSIHRWWNSR